MEAGRAVQPTPLVSVLIPTYQRLPLLREAVASVLAQSYREWELIVVDDGSTDGTREWLESLGEPRVRALPLAHSGNLGHVRNQGIRAARGELLCFLDSDDAFEPEKLAAQIAALAAHPDAGWSYTALTRVDHAGRERHDRGVRPWREISGWILPELLRFDALVDTPTVMVRRSLLEQVGLLDESLPESQDYELFFRMAAASPAVAVPRALTRKRVHDGSLSSDRMKVHEAWITIYERFGRASADAAVRRICAEEARRHRIGAAMRRGAAGEPGRALAHLLPALRGRPWSLPAWRALALGVALQGTWFGLRKRWGGGRARGAAPPPRPERDIR